MDYSLREFDDLNFFRVSFKWIYLPNFNFFNVHSQIEKRNQSSLLKLKSLKEFSQDLLY